LRRIKPTPSSLTILRRASKARQISTSRAVSHVGNGTLIEAALRRRIEYSGPGIFSYGFRPFFLGGAARSAVSVALWLPQYFGEISLPTAFGPLDWHVHEMIYGFAAATVSGFLLTAIPNWTGRLPVNGYPLAGLFTLWFFGRLAIAGSAIWGAWPAAVVDVTFLAICAAVALGEIIAGKNWRKLRVFVILGVLIAGNVVCGSYYSRQCRLRCARRHRGSDRIDRAGWRSHSSKLHLQLVGTEQSRANAGDLFTIRCAHDRRQRAIFGCVGWIASIPRSGRIVSGGGATAGDPSPALGWRSHVRRSFSFGAPHGIRLRAAWFPNDRCGYSLAAFAGQRWNPRLDCRRGRHDDARGDDPRKPRSHRTAARCVRTYAADLFVRTPRSALAYLCRFHAIERPALRRSSLLVPSVWRFHRFLWSFADAAPTCMGCPNVINLIRRRRLFF
jgi:hypothetical protein